LARVLIYDIRTKNNHMENTNTKLISLTSATEKSDAALLVSGELYHTGCSMFGTEVSLLENGILSQKYICCLNGFFISNWIMKSNIKW